MKYRKKPVTIEAHQWFKNGDHPMVKRLKIQLNALQIQLDELKKLEERGNE